MNKKEKGITLVALVVTIIVLLILAGITINLIMGENGLFSRATKGKLKYEIESAREEIVLAIANEELRSQSENFEWQKVWEELSNNDSNFKEPKEEVADFNIKYKKHDYIINENKEVKHSESCEYCKGEYIEDEARYTITYKTNGGTGEDIVQYIDEGSQIKEAGFIKEEYEFVGWNTSEDGLGEDYTVGQHYTGKQNIILYAKWQGRVTGSINFNQNILTEGTKIGLEVTAPTTQITKIEVQIGGHVIYSETMQKNAKNYNKEIEITEKSSLSNLENLKFNNKYTPSIKITSLNNLEETIETEEITSYLITDANDLKNLATQVNVGNKFEGKNILQVKNIDLSEVCSAGKGNWTPIGVGSGDNWFNGTYNGASYNISNIYYNGTSNIQLGLFGFVGYKGSVKKIVLSGTINSNSCTYAMGGIAGRNEGIIEDCINNATITRTVKDNGIGGIAGTNFNTIKNCINNGDITGMEYGTAGIAGFVNMSNDSAENKLISNGNSNLITIYIEGCKNTGNITASYRTGGIIGRCKDTIISKCQNTGSITSNKISYVANDNSYGTGGIVGNLNMNCRIEDSSNTGTIVQKTDKFVGGIAGVAVDNAIIERCYNYNGSVEAKTNAAGGILGKVTRGTPTIKNCYNYLAANYHIQAEGGNAGGIIGKIDTGANITNCYSIGEIITGTNKGAILGAAGGSGTVKIKNCYYYATESLKIEGSSDSKVQITSTSKKELTEFKYPISNKSSVVYLLNNGEESDNAFAQDDDINGGYPYLASNVPKD